MEKWEWLVDTFTIIGMLVCILVTLIALAWVVCFAVKLLVKTFNVKVGSSYDILVEDIKKKGEAKKERKEIKRTKQAERKMELLNMKEESKNKVHDMKKQKLADKLETKENNEAKKLFNEPVLSKLKSKTTEKVKEEKVEEKKQAKNVEKTPEPEDIKEEGLEVEEGEE